MRLPPLRKSLVQSMIDGAVPMARRQPLVSLLSEPDPRNLDAQVLLFQSELAGGATRTALEKQFVGASSDALQTLLGFSTGQPAAAAADARRMLPSR